MRINASATKADSVRILRSYSTVLFPLYPCKQRENTIKIKLFLLINMNEIQELCWHIMFFNFIRPSLSFFSSPPPSFTISFLLRLNVKKKMEKGEENSSVEFTWKSNSFSWNFPSFAQYLM